MGGGRDTHCCGLAILRDSPAECKASVANPTRHLVLQVVSGRRGLRSGCASLGDEAIIFDCSPPRNISDTLTGSLRVITNAIHGLPPAPPGKSKLGIFDPLERF